LKSCISDEYKNIYGGLHATGKKMIIIEKIKL
jgi:hypothetical protein